jgi:ribosomal-protein-alanine N-acetyltransferase
MRSEEYTIVPLKEKDAPALAALEAGVFATAWSEDQYQKLLRGLDLARSRAHKPLPPFLVLGLLPERPALDAELGTDVSPQGRFLAAYISLGLHHAAGEMEIYNIACAPDYRRQGFARALLLRALEAARRMGLERALLEVRESNAPALGLYRSLNFQPVGRRKGYYADTGEDALLLVRPVLDAFSMNNPDKE